MHHGRISNDIRDQAVSSERADFERWRQEPHGTQQPAGDGGRDQPPGARPAERHHQQEQQQDPADVMLTAGQHHVEHQRGKLRDGPPAAVTVEKPAQQQRDEREQEVRAP
jgi:hypothetical protein